MTTEELRLEIQVAVKDALKNLKATSDEVKRLAKEAKDAVPPADQLKDTMNRLQADLKKTETAASLFGDQLGGLKERQALLRSAMVDLMDKGIAPEAKEMQDLKLEYEAAGVASKEMEERTRVMSGSLSDLQGSLGAIAAVKAFTTVATGVLDMGKAAINTAGRYEMLQANFETLTGSTAAAAAEFKQLRQYANVTPFSLEGTAKAAQQLQAAKTSVGDLITRLGQLGDLSLGNQQKFDSMVGAFSKMSVKGKVDLEQMNIFMEAGVPILDELARGYGKTETAVFDMMSKGEVSTADFIGAMQRMTSEGGQFFGGMARGAKTWEGLWSTYKDSIDGVAASYGELLLPAAKAIIGVLTNINNAISDSPLLQGVLAAVLVTAVTLLGIWAVKMAAATAAAWLHYAATMALNAAKAIGNPILIAGIAAVALATAGFIAYAATQNKATAATDEASAATKASARNMKDTAEATKAAEEAAKSYQRELDRTTLKELEAMKAAMEWMKVQAAKPGAGGWTSEMEANLRAVGKELEEKKKAFEDLNKKAQEFKDSWAKTYGSSIAASSGDPYAPLEFERRQKLAEATAAGIGDANKRVIDEINAYYDTKHCELADSIELDEHKRLAKLSKSKIDDMVLERDTELALFKGTAWARAAIAMDWNRRITETELAEATEVADARIAEAQRVATETIKKNAAVWDAANAQRAFEARLSASKVDDLQLQRDRELALFTGTEEQRFTLAKYYSRQISDARIEDAKRQYQEELALAAQKGDWGSYAGKKAGDLAKDTEVGKMLGLGGQKAQDWKQVLIDSALGMVMQNEAVRKVLNIFSTLLGGIVSRVLPPLAQALTWLYDSIIVPVGNAIIAVINAVIRGINWALGWLGVHISQIEKLQTSDEIARAQKLIKQKAEAVAAAIDGIRTIFDSRKQELSDAYQKNIGALRNLLELGALTEADFSARVAQTNEGYKSDLQSVLDEEKSQLAVLQGILDRLNTGIDVSVEELAAAGIGTENLNDVPQNTPLTPWEEAQQRLKDYATAHGWHAEGAVDIPETHVAVVHKGEMIIPTRFADGLRSGNISLGKGTQAQTVNINTTVHVAGSAVAMDGLADDLAVRINRRVRRGLVEPS
jgi:tape measure domain-containing protein